MHGGVVGGLEKPEGDVPGAPGHIQQPGLRPRGKHLHEVILPQPVNTHAHEVIHDIVFGRHVAEHLLHYSHARQEQEWGEMGESSQPGK